MSAALDQQTHALLAACCGDRSIRSVETVQSLWSDYGRLVRIRFTDGRPESVIVKCVRPPDAVKHPRGWQGIRSDQRKRYSYAVEAAWYQRHAQALPSPCRVPAALGVDINGRGSMTLVLEDLDPEFPRRNGSLDDDGTLPCIEWLAAFHAAQLGTQAPLLWPVGCYWHLDTRPDEFNAMTKTALKKAAAQLDKLLKSSPFQTLVHGDAKLANFCFSADGSRVAAVDFQYVGHGPGVRDLAYFLGSALDERALMEHADSLVDTYFNSLRDHLPRDLDAEALERDWRTLLPVAVADFERFLAGWAPRHYKRNKWSREMTELALTML